MDTFQSDLIVIGAGLAGERIAITADEGSFQERDPQLRTGDPLGFPGYREKLVESEARSSIPESMIWGECTIDGISVALTVMGALASV